MKMTYIPSELAYVIVPQACPRLIKVVEAAFDRGEINVAECSDWVRFLRTVERLGEKPE